MTFNDLRFFLQILLNNYLEIPFAPCNLDIDAHREGGGGAGGGTSCTPSKDFEKLDHKIAIKRKNRGPPPRFSHNPKYPPQKNLHRETERGLLRQFFRSKILKNV
jgi:hypothetical protein